MINHGAWRRAPGTGREFGRRLFRQRNGAAAEPSLAPFSPAASRVGLRSGLFALEATRLDFARPRENGRRFRGFLTVVSPTTLPVSRCSASSTR